MKKIKLPRRAKKAFIKKLNRGEYIAFCILGKILAEEGEKRNVFKEPTPPHFRGDFENLYVYRKCEVFDHCILIFDKLSENQNKNLKKLKRYTLKINSMWKIMNEKHDPEVLLKYLKSPVYRFYCLRKMRKDK